MAIQFLKEEGQQYITQAEWRLLDNTVSGVKTVTRESQHRGFSAEEVRTYEDSLFFLSGTRYGGGDQSKRLWKIYTDLQGALYHFFKANNSYIKWRKVFVQETAELGVMGGLVALVGLY